MVQRLNACGRGDGVPADATPSETRAVDATFSTHRCLNKEDEFQTSIKEMYFREGDVHFELFPSTTKSIESFCSLLAAEASLRERRCTKSNFAALLAHGSI